jgi:uncharacterized lipoprotein YajG
VNLHINHALTMNLYPRTHLALLGTSVLLLAGCASPPAAAPTLPSEAPPQDQACPQGVPVGARAARTLRRRTT